MSIFDRFFRSKERPPAALDDANLRRVFGELAQELEHQEVEPALVRARLADGYRDAGLEPLLPEDFDALTAGLDEAAWQRLAVAVRALEEEEVQQALPALLGDKPVADQVRAGFIDFARQSDRLTLALLRQSRLRTEEFARRFIASLGAGVEGESLAESAERLSRIDYGRLLDQAEEARGDAEARMAYLKALLEEQERQFAPRGKW
jgi:hypothetical protein